MGNSSAFMTSPPCMHRCFLPGPTPFTGAHWPQTDRKWLAVEQRGVGVSLGAILVGTWVSAGRCHLARPSLAMMATLAPRFRVAKEWEGGDSAVSGGDLATAICLWVSVSQFVKWQHRIKWSLGSSVYDFCVGLALVQKVLYCCSFLSWLILFS